MHYRLADYVLWLLTPSLQAGVLLAMYRRGLNRRYPLFLAYTMLQVASAVILAFLAATSYTGYYYAYWCNLVLSIVISFFVLWEIVKRALRRPRSKGVRLFPVLCAVVLLIAALELCLTRGPLSGEFVTSSMMLSDRSLRLLQTVLFLVLIFFSKALRLSRKSITFGLALGFGLFAIVNILVATTLSAWIPDFPGAFENKQCRLCHRRPHLARLCHLRIRGRKRKKTREFLALAR